VLDVNEFRKGMGLIAKWEWGDKEDGGYTNDPEDPGGETKWGISKRAHPELDIKRLTPEKALEIYAKDYWEKCGCDQIDFPLNVLVFDTAVNIGPARALGWLKASKDTGEYLNFRKQHYISIINKDPPKVRFLRGWLGRLNDLAKFIDINTP
jgi:hypothetical protein